MRATPDRDHAAPAQKLRAAASEPGPQGTDETTPGSPERARPTTEPPVTHCIDCSRPLGLFDPTPFCRSCNTARTGPDDPYDPPEPLRLGAGLTHTPLVSPAPSCTAQAYASGVPLRTIQLHLRHENIGVTDTYLRGLGLDESRERVYQLAVPTVPATALLERFATSRPT